MKVNKYIYKEFFFLYYYINKNLNFGKFKICHSDIIFLFQKINSKVVFLLLSIMKKVIYVSLKFLNFLFWYFFPLYNWNWNPIFFKILFFLECCCFEMRKYKFIFKKWFVPNIIFFWNIFWYFFPHVSPSKTRPTDKQHRNRKTLNKTHKHAVAREDLQFFFCCCTVGDFCRRATQCSVCRRCVGYTSLGLVFPLRSALAFPRQAITLVLLVKFSALFFAAARSSWNIFVPFPTALDFRRSASGFWSGTGFIAQGSIFFCIACSSLIVGWCAYARPAFSFRRKNVSGPQSNVVGVKTLFRRWCLFFFDLQPSTRSENSHTSKARSKGAPQVTLGLMKSKARTWVFLWRKTMKVFFLYNVFFYVKNFITDICYQKKPFLLVVQKGNIIFKTTIL